MLRSALYLIYHAHALRVCVVSIYNVYALRVCVGSLDYADAYVCIARNSNYNLISC